MKTISRQVTSARVAGLVCALLIALSLIAPSSALAVDPQFTFEGGGWGHGIGLSQWGARGYALKGWGYDRILTHYYQGTKIVSKPAATIRVNLDDEGDARSQWWIKAGSDTTLTVKQYTDKENKITLTKSSSYWITVKNGDTRVHKNLAYKHTDPTTGATSTRYKPGDVLKTFDGSCYATAGGKVKLLGSSGPYNHVGVIWRGYVRFSPVSSTASTSKAINHVDLESYLYGVVPRESPASWPAEALKAQAVAARSYAYQDAVDKKVIYCTTRSQVYNGYKGPKGGEVASTNAAVNATAGKVVWFGSETKPVKTYFSSCSGGHTADIEDVWTSASPKPYYRGVSDADEDSPYYRWKLSALSAKSVAEKIRARDLAGGGGLEYSAPSPATVTNISTERADSGYTHHATVTWSNGKKHRITGDTLRRALGMKSTKFSVARTYPVLSTQRYQDSDGKLAWTGPWTTQTKDAVSGGTLRHSSTAGALVSAKFTGTGFAWTGTRGPIYGKAEVYIDGTLKKTVDVYASTTAFKQTIYRTTNLAPGTHSITIKVLGTKSSASTGHRVPVDTIEVYNGTASALVAPLTRIEQDDPDFAFVGAWRAFSNTSDSGGTHLFTAEPKARYYASFYGSEVRWIGTASPKYGSATVSIDGGPAEKITITAETTTYRKTLYKKTGLAQDRMHTIVIEASGKGGTKGYTGVDAIDVRGGWTLPANPPVVTLQESSGALSWKGTWNTTTSSLLSGGAQRWSKTKSSEATLTFDGTRVAFIGRKARWYGRSKLYLDGAYQATVDQYSASTKDGEMLWSSPRLKPGHHTLRVVVTGTRQSAATAVTVGVDRFDVNGRALTQ